MNIYLIVVLTLLAGIICIGLLLWFWLNSKVEKLLNSSLKDTKIRMTVEEIEAKHGVDESWSKLLKQMQPGDELYEYVSCPHSWAHLAGWSGIILVRNGETIDSICHAMN